MRDPGSTGWPRPMMPWRFVGSTRCPELPDRLPVPWLNGPCVRDHGDWHSFREHGLEKMRARRLCLVCGRPVRGAIYLPAQGDPQDRVTSGGGGHARCVLLAVKCCPHLVSRDYEADDVVGWRYEGRGLGFTSDEMHGDCDPVADAAVEITLAELREAVRLEVRA